MGHPPNATFDALVIHGHSPALACVPIRPGDIKWFPSGSLRRPLQHHSLGSCLSGDALHVASAGADRASNFEDADTLLAEPQHRGALLHVIVPRTTESLAFGLGPGEPCVNAL